MSTLVFDYQFLYNPVVGLLSGVGVFYGEASITGGMSVGMEGLI